MAIKHKYQNEADIPAALKSEYSQSTDGNWYCEVEGFVPKAKLDEFRNTSIAAQNKLKEVEAKYDGIDPEEARSLKERAADLEAGKLYKKGDVDAAVNLRLGPVEAAHQKVLKEKEDALNGMRSKLEKATIESALTQAAVEAGVRKEAIPDLLLRGRQIYRLDEKGDVVAIDPQTNDVKTGADGRTYPMKEFLSGLSSAAPHLFEPSRGGGGNGSPRAGGGTAPGKNPFVKDAGGNMNMTAASALMRDNPSEAARLAAEAGVALPGV